MKIYYGKVKLNLLAVLLIFISVFIKTGAPFHVNLSNIEEANVIGWTGNDVDYKHLVPIAIDKQTKGRHLLLHMCSIMAYYRTYGSGSSSLNPGEYTENERESFTMN